MLAKNPNGGDPIEVVFPSGPEFSRYEKVCLDCGRVVGGCFSGPGLPEPVISKYAICPKCFNKCRTAGVEYKHHIELRKI